MKISNLFYPKSKIEKTIRHITQVKIKISKTNI